MFSLSPANQQNLTRFLKTMVQTASFSGMEGGLAQVLSAEMQKTGLDDVTIDDMGNVIGRLGNGRGPKLLYYSHMDTVGIGNINAWQHDPFSGITENNVMYGRGVVEPKGSLAGMVYGARLLLEAQTKLNGTLYIVGGVYGESAEGVAIKYLLEDWGLEPDWVVIGAPTDLQINIGQRGRLEMLVTVNGHACHAATPQHGVNAIYGAARIIFSLELMSAQLGDDPFLGPGTLAVTHIENIERTKNIIPDRCTFNIDRRLTLGETEAHALADVQSLLAKEGIEGAVEVAECATVSYTGKSCSGKKSYPAWLMDEKDPLVKRAGKSIQKVTGHKPKAGCWNFSTAGVYTSGYAGIPTVGFGPGRERRAHTANEYISLRDCFTAAKGYAQIARDMLK